ncbi:MAG: hypothetical protein IJB53_09925 [Mailhella sp.]|nr:hypothetical protein [Mailhella sp.]
MISSITARFLQGIDDAQVTPVLRERIELAKDMLIKYSEENDSLRKENIILQDKIAVLTEENKKLLKDSFLVDLGVAKIKLDSSGKRLPICFCPQCGGTLTDPDTLDQRFLSNLSLTCMKKCGYGVKADTLSKILKQWAEAREQNL